MTAFDICRLINEALERGSEAEARDDLIRLLAKLDEEEVAYNPLVNHLIRKVGLYPYMRPESSHWQDGFVCEAFKFDTGDAQPRVLHREQSFLLRHLLDGHDIAVSAPTSFGKSFVIDAFIAVRRPTNAVIIVPTIALTDETRRRLQRKFGSRYKIITTPDATLAERNIFVFPQERAISYTERINHLDLLVIDEFYKASQKFDKERSPALLRAILRLMDKASQRYFLAPNISALKDSLFTRGMEFLHLDFKTVYLDVHEMYRAIGRDENEKARALIALFRESRAKTLVYAGTYTAIDSVGTLLLDEVDSVESGVLRDFSKWLAENYSEDWVLTKLVSRGVGIHNGSLHRSLSQIQVRLFEMPDGLNTLVSTSSIIEGVNTSAERVIIWSNRNGKAALTDFAYKNVIGRGGRMFKHFIGHIYLLEKPPDPVETQLELSVPDEIVHDHSLSTRTSELSEEQLAKLHAYNEEMLQLLGMPFERFQEDHELEISDANVILAIARELSLHPERWNGLGYLNSDDPRDWERHLFQIFRLQPAGWGVRYTQLVAFVQILSRNWTLSIPQLLYELEEHDIGIDDFFKLERSIAFKLSALLADLNALQAEILPNPSDISPFIAKVSHAFLPRVVFYLEEYGLPRSISRKIQASGLLDLEADHFDVHDIIAELRTIGSERLTSVVGGLDAFDGFILDHFFEGIA